MRPERSNSSDLQTQARALGDPTRHDLFQYLVAASRSVDVAELTEHLGLHHNAVRQHLAKLVDAGLVMEETAPRAGRGRPRLVYSVDPSADSRWGATGPYERLSLLLSEIIRTGDNPVEVGRRAGRQLPLTATVAVDPAEGVTEAMRQQGFAPTSTRVGERVELALHSCPFANVALADPDTVCGLHLGLAYGVAAEVGGVTIDELVRQDPRRGKCVLRLHVET